MAAKDFTLWGHNPRVLPEPYPIRLTGGSLRHCRSEQRDRTEQGWTVGIYATGDNPLGLRDKVVATQPDPVAARARLAEIAADGCAWLAVP